MANRLGRESSPYLLQHADNPVDWYPWGDEAFARARRERKIVFLSIGYATCHWCHVMERESFEDREVADVLNRLTVPVKVDREERPDVDQVYMAVCQALTGSGGWPLTILLTPDRLPFFAGTYLPKRSRGGRVGVIELVQRAAALWAEDPDRVRRSAGDVVANLRRAGAGSADPGEPDPDLLTAATDELAARFDPVHGGFGPAPKFPTPHNLVFLLRRTRRTGDPAPARMAVGTLRAMARGGIHDHLGGGFHRYATDPEWLLPHFEKMLYDQAGLLAAYTEAYGLVRAPDLAATARDVAGYVLRDLADPAGGFHSAEDADSEGEEGRYYVWTRDEILEVLGPGDGDRFCRVYGVAADGNFLDEAARRRTGANVLHLARPLDAWAREMGAGTAELEEVLARDRERLYSARTRRVRPLRDDKVLAGWNGLMISALARTGAVLGEPGYVAAAGRAADFVLARLRPEGRLLRRYRAGRATIPAAAEDAAFLVRALLDLYAATFDPSRLAAAVDVAGELVDRFWDGADGGLFDTAHDGDELVWRPREVYDGAMPSANSVAVEALARLGLLTGDPVWTDRAWATARAFAGRVRSYPAGFTAYLTGLAVLVEPTREVVIAGQPGHDDTGALVAAVRRVYAPEAAAVLAPPGEAGGAIRDLAPFVAGMTPVGGQAAAYLCQNATCQAPLVEPGALAAALATPPPDGDQNSEFRGQESGTPAGRPGS